MINFIDGDPFLSASAWGRTEAQAMNHIKFLIASTVENTFCQDYLIAVGDTEDSNFRSKLHLDYKKSKSREASKKKRPIWFPNLKAFLLEQKNVVKAVGVEADDLIRMWSCQAEASGDPFLVSSIDKDLDCIPGKHYSPKTQEFYDVTEDDADFFYWQQVLQGDSVDNIPGLPGIGPVKAKQFLYGTTSTEERKQIVIKAYQDTYGDEWWEYLNVNGRLIHMWRHVDDFFHIPRT